MARSNLSTRRLAAASLLFAAMALVAVLAISAAPGRADPALDSEESQFLVLINDYRAQNDRGSLVIQPQLNASADWLSTDMAAKDYFSHTDSLGRNPSQRAAAFGYPYGAGENAACGFTTAQAVFEAWKNSAGHNANMLGASYKVIGIGRAQGFQNINCGGGPFDPWYWTTDFGLVVAGATPNPSPSQTPAHTPSPTPTPAPTPTSTPTPTPTPTPVAYRGDVNCDGTVTSVDALEILRHRAGLGVSQQPGCPSIGSNGGGSQPASAGAPSQGVFGDVDCNGQVDGVDALEVLRYVAHLPATLPDGCPAVGT